MTQLSSNTLVYQQVFDRLRRFFLKDFRKEFKSNQQRLEEYNRILQDLYNNISAPSTKYDPYIKGEPPRSSKINVFSQNLAYDLKNAMAQTDYLTAKTINFFNLFQSEIENEKKYVQRIFSKAKILQMYNKAESEDLIYFGDSFDNLDFIDVSKIKRGYIPTIKDGSASFPIRRKQENSFGKISILSGNGFLGNNHQVNDAVSDEGATYYRYIGLDNPSLSRIEVISDSNPLTFMEYEALKVDKSVYEESDRPSENEFCYVTVNGFSTNEPAGSLVNWSNFDEDVLKFTLEFSNNSSRNLINNIEITPFFGSVNLIKVTSIKVFNQEDVSEEVLDSPIYIGSNLDPLNIEIAKNYFYFKANITFSERIMTKALITFEQESPSDIKILHAYWQPDYSEDYQGTSPFVGLSRFNPDSLVGFEEIIYDIKPILPKVNDPFAIKKNDNARVLFPISLKKERYTEQFNVIVFTEKDSNLKFYFSNFKDWPGATPTEYPENIVFTSDLEYANLNTSTKRYESSQDAEDDIESLKKYFINESDIEVSLGVYAIQTSKLFPLGNAPIDTTFFKVDLDSITVESKSREVVPELVAYDVPLKKVDEELSAKRFCVGIRDISFSYEEYESNMEIVSKPFTYPSDLEALMLDVDMSIDKKYLKDLKIEYFISVEQSRWIRISPIQLDFSGIPEVILFNQAIPQSQHLNGISYFDQPDVPPSIRSATFKMTVSKNRNINITPRINSYQLISRIKI